MATFTKTVIVITTTDFVDEANGKRSVALRFLLVARNCCFCRGRCAGRLRVLS